MSAVACTILMLQPIYTKQSGPYTTVIVQCIYIIQPVYAETFLLMVYQATISDRCDTRLLNYAMTIHTVQPCHLVTAPTGHVVCCQKNVGA